MIKIGVIGCGQWGPNHIRNFSSIPECRVLMCADLNADRLKAMREIFREIHPTKNYRDILRNPEIDAVVISTPTEYHYALVRESLSCGKDVLCEKPLCVRVDDAKALIKLSRNQKKILMTGHVFLFNAGIRRMKEMIQSGECGRIYYLHSERTNLGPFRTDVNAVWDLASHDVSISNFLLDEIPVEVSARGGKYLQRDLEDVAFISLVYPKGVLVNIHVSWLDPRKVREMTLVGDKKMVIWDDLDMVGPIRIYNRRVVKEFYYENFGEFHLLAKEGDVTIPKIQLSEPLKVQANHFLDCVRTRRKPLSDGCEALDVVKVLCAVQKSMKSKGAPVAIAG